MRQLASAAGGRHRLSWWQAQGLLPSDLQPARVAAAFIRATGRPPARDPSRKQSRAYSAPELLIALGQLAAEPSRPPQTPAPAAITAPPAPPPPPRPRHPQPASDPLAELWREALGHLVLPSTRMLLSMQARLLGVTPCGDRLLVAVGIGGNWLAMVRSRAVLLSEALERTLGRSVVLRLVELAEPVEAGR